MMGITIKTKPKLTSALAEKTKARKKKLEQDTSLVALAASSQNDLLPKMRLEKKPIAQIKGLKRRVRKSDRAQVARVARSIKTHKQAAPILVSEDNVMIHGHVVAQALKSLGETHVWCAIVDDLDENQREMLHVALNRIGECGDWDLDALGPLLIELGDLGFDLESTGFTFPELDIIMDSTEKRVEPPAIDAEVEPPQVPVSLLGDLWKLDRHYLLCGDATDPSSYSVVLGDERADAIFTDCPWNIPIEGFVSGLGKTKHKNFKMAVGEMSSEEFRAFCETFTSLAAQHLHQGGAFFSCIDWRSVDLIMHAGRKAGLRHINTAVWNKGSGGMGAPYRSAHEFVVVLCKGDKLAVNNVQLGKHGRDRTNVWAYPGANRQGSSASKALADHPTPKPVEMVEDALKDVTNRGALVLDPFLGSGTTLIAAERSGRSARGIELDPGYVDVAIKRREELSGKEAIHVATGLSFAKLGAQRGEDLQKDAA